MDGLALGRIVRYVVDAHAATAITTTAAHRRHVNNPVSAGTIAAAMVVGINDAPTGRVNLTVFLDGVDTHWATSVPYDAGKAPGTWHWPDVPAAPARTSKRTTKGRR